MTSWSCRPARVRIKTGGGNAGHNGLRSISAHMGNDYKRVRIGIGHPGNKELVHSYVLSDFAKAEQPGSKRLCDAIADNAGLSRTRSGFVLPEQNSSDDGSEEVSMTRRRATPTDRIATADDVIMGFKCGIVGLPNVGKSTLFNALTETAAAQAANYPFCTIEPNVGEVSVPDPRLDKLAASASRKRSCRRG